MGYIIILGGPLTSNLQPGAWLLSRLNTAIQYYKNIDKNKKDNIKLIVTGGYTYDKKISEADVMKKYLVKHKIPENIIIKENQARNTIENAIYSKKLTILNKSTDDNNIVVITSDFHVPRSKIIFVNEFGKHRNITFIGAKTQISDVIEQTKINDNEKYLIGKLEKYYKIYFF